LSCFCFFWNCYWWKYVCIRECFNSQIWKAQ